MKFDKYEKIGWEESELCYFPKRKVNNNLSWKIHHVMGSFYSNKMKRTVEYESLGECLFYFLLELVPKVEKYYVQPVEISIPFFTDEGDINNWIHVPDVLVFGTDMKPTIYQIKENPMESKKHELVNKVCEEYCLENEWCYKVIYPKKLPENILFNIKFLQGSIRKRKGFEEMIPDIVNRLEKCSETTIYELAYSFASEINPLSILPVIYHLIATGVFHIDLTNPISIHSGIRLKNLSEQFLPFINLESELFEH